MIRVIESRSDAVVAIEVSEKITKKDFHGVEQAFRETANRYGKIRVLMMVGEYTGVSWDFILEDIEFNKEFYKYYDKVAVVSDQKWMKPIIKIEDYFIKADMKYFDLEQQNEAWEWITQE
ncbi:STAS/SEC14 domain-containing protein [Aneurinibacillus uraniidurans]|uniref:STAS/SEC14 domain-containing protein n=1 Tax=Aneurinibacillus uraniidurans TaxID=2966586 RepID=UPI002349EB24|nr:STAS/SEC14 domain-containing protein [Aneurinibacillus sp. B1]WCN37576.1 STAS/SEC14 domain-containing protein [Aneurinibacillus sp. B1]